jgi:hypothetical protein
MKDDDKSRRVPSPELTQCIQALRSILRRCIRLIDGIIAVLVGHESAKAVREEDLHIDEPMVLATVPVLQAIGSSSNTLLSLSETPGLQTRDCYSIVRSIVEACINICYTIAEGPDAADQALRYARQKAFRDLERQSRVGESAIHLVYSAIPDPGTIEGLEDDLEEFTSRTGREKGWTDLSVDDRIAIAGERLGGSVLNSLHFARFSIYRHSSEILHGTLFSALYFWGTTSPSGPHSSLQEWAENVGQQHMMILFAAIVAISAVVEAFHRTYGLPRAFEQSREFFNELREIPYLQDDATP